VRGGDNEVQERDARKGEEEYARSYKILTMEERKVRGREKGERGRQGRKGLFWLAGDANTAETQQNGLKKGVSNQAIVLVSHSDSDGGACVLGASLWRISVGVTS
jgi:hypothetical protein